MGAVIFLVIGIPACFIIGQTTSWCSGAVQVAQEQFNARELLRKYEWFKNASAQLDAKTADIELYKQRFDTLPKGNVTAWPRHLTDQYMIWQSEYTGIRASYNALASEYNAQMSKFNWRFTNAGDVPEGGKPLPREYREYNQ